ncbi:MAG: hypothetical protein WDM96_17680 [Lacunisphaera sp.]
MQTQKGGRRVTHDPWPFIRGLQRAGYDGFELWPLFGRNRHVGDYDHQFYLWPLIYKSEEHLSAPTPDVAVGVLPFYARANGPGYRSETFVWPFFGYTHRTQPDTYNEQRYLWPFLVQAAAANAWSTAGRPSIPTR